MFAFPPETARLPRAADPLMAERQIAHWLSDVGQRTEFCAAYATDRQGRALLEAALGASPHLAMCLFHETAFFQSLAETGPDACFAALMAGLEEDGAGESDLARLMQLLRIARRRAALLIGLADIAGTWDLGRVTAALSDLAEKALSLAVRHLLKAAAAAGEIELADPGDPERDSGLVLLGMGKLGARELNYSSDVDLIVFFDPDKVRYQGRKTVQEFFVRMIRDIARILEERTAEGYVFRVDLRLRPDPGSTPPAISLLAAEAYYEGFGQNWERAAMIKARQLAGDRQSGAQFFKFIASYVWRRHLDFAAIEDIHSIKRQIDAHRGGGRIKVPGHNVKLGRGGIREIEFFAQTQQLIWGGREPALRLSATLDALAALAAAGHVSPEAAAELSASYAYLRRVEHRLQMIDDQQTQTLPQDEGRLDHLALFLGHDGQADFAAQLMAAMERVEFHYAHLFEDAPILSGPGNLVFTGTESDPETLKTLAGLGFKDAETVAAHIRGWHHGHVRATRSARAREILTELTPALLDSLGRTGDPDTAFRRFDSFLAGLPAGVPLFSLFAANPVLMDLVAEVMGDSPRLAEELSGRPSLLDAVLTTGFFEPPPERLRLVHDLAAALESAQDVQDLLDIARRWTNELKFRMGLLILRGLIGPMEAAGHFSDLADAVLIALYPRILAEFVRAHGLLPGAGMAIVALGKLGSREMTANSDLDLILIYDAPDHEAVSDGAKPLPPGSYFARLAQRLINALTAKTGDGALYEVDMRLRPSGSAGPIATSLASFARYNAKEAWTWEHMALTRARIVVGDPRLGAAIRAVIDDSLAGRRDADRLLADVADMRRRMAREHKAPSIWDVKHLRGGLVDVEFIAQYLQLRHAREHPAILRNGTADALRAAEALDLLSPADARVLLKAHRLWTAVQQVLRQTVQGLYEPARSPVRLKEILVRASGFGDYDALVAGMERTARAVIAVYDRLIETPAREIAAAHPEKDA